MREPLRLVCIEEHHEAFYVWQYARRHGWISAKPTTLLHVDEHRDMALPVLRCALPGVRSTLRQAACFTYAELSITTFVWAGVLCHFFDRVLWMRVQHDSSAGSWRRIGIRPRTAAGRSFLTTVVSGFEPMPPRQSSVIEYAPLSAGENAFLGGDCILDIDLDYFCWNDFPELGPCCLRVPEETFQEVQANPYHFLRLAANSKVSAVAGNSGEYKLCLQDIARPLPVVTPAAVVLQRIEEFIEFLSRCGVKASLAVVCRSRHSGWVQSAHVEFAERALLDRLQGLFAVDQFRIDELLRGHLHEEDIFAPVPQSSDQKEFSPCQPARY